MVDLHIGKSRSLNREINGRYKFDEGYENAEWAEEGVGTRQKPPKADREEALLK